MKDLVNNQNCLEKGTAALKTEITSGFMTTAAIPAKRSTMHAQFSWDIKSIEIDCSRSAIINQNLA